MNPQRECDESCVAFETWGVEDPEEREIIKNRNERLHCYKQVNASERLVLTLSNFFIELQDKISEVNTNLENSDAQINRQIDSMCG